MKKRTKIIATIGPSSERLEILLSMVKAGMDVCRLNFSHGNYANHKQLIQNIRAVAKTLKKPLAIMQDLQGPRVRIGKIIEKGIQLKKGDKIIFTCALTNNLAGKIQKTDKIPITYNQLFKDIKKDERILINDGLIEAKVKNIHSADIICTVQKGGMLTSGRGMNFPDSKLSIPVITEKDKKDLSFGLKQGADYVALSFVRSKEDIAHLKRLILRLSGKKKIKIKIIAKIERKEALDNLDEILEAADGLMVARGDLGIEIEPEKVPIWQKKIISECLKAYKPVIVATQMLDSMQINPKPTRAEVSDVANAVIDHADCLMLSGETATGKYPIEAVRKMSEVICEVEKSNLDDFIYYDISNHKNILAAQVCKNAQSLARDIGARAIIVNTMSGFSAQAVSAHRPEISILAFTPNEEVSRQLNLVWGVRGYVLGEFENTTAFLKHIFLILKKDKIIKKGDKAVLVSGLKRSAKKWMNSIIVVEV